MVRIHNSKRLIREVVRVNQKNTPDGKPNGLWYATGNQWLDWCADSMTGWIGDYNYEIILNEDFKLLKIDTGAKLIQFDKQFGQLDRDIKFINWKRVAELYDGIEISPYQWDFRFSLFWYYGWDIASGCLWNKNFQLKEMQSVK